MDKALLLDAMRQLDALGSAGEPFAREQAVRQFNALLQQAKSFYPNRPDINAMVPYKEVTITYREDFLDAVRRLRQSLELRPPGSITQVAESITLPPDAPTDLVAALQEFKEAVAIGLQKSALLLAGSLAEALLLMRHPDTSERGPGLRDLFREATSQRLFGRDTLRQLETLIDYRDLIHARAGIRNRMVLNEARIEQAVMAIRQLCADLQDRDIMFQ